MTVAIIIGVIVVLGLYVICNYNGLVKARLKTKNAWSQIDIQLQKRFDLIPNIVEIVKGYAKYESSTFAKIADIRSSWANADTMKEKNEVTVELDSVLKSVFAIAENYPELKANENFKILQTELSDVESNISFARQFYNDTVTMYNTKIELFPSTIFAKLFGFKAETLFEVKSNTVNDAIKVQL